MFPPPFSFICTHCKLLSMHVVVSATKTRNSSSVMGFRVIMGDLNERGPQQLYSSQLDHPPLLFLYLYQPCVHQPLVLPELQSLTDDSELLMGHRLLHKSSGSCVLHRLLLPPPLHSPASNHHIRLKMSKS